jgi:hypothetical protein
LPLSRAARVPAFRGTSQVRESVEAAHRLEARSRIGLDNPQDGDSRCHARERLDLGSRRTDRLHEPLPSARGTDQQQR